MVQTRRVWTCCADVGLVLHSESTTASEGGMAHKLGCRGRPWGLQGGVGKGVPVAPIHTFRGMGRGDKLGTAPPAP